MDLSPNIQALSSIPALQTATASAAAVLESLTVTAAPAACAAIVASRASILNRACVLACLVCWLLLSRYLRAEPGLSFGGVAAAHLYYASAAAGMFSFMPFVARGLIGRGTALVACFVAFLLLPALAFDRTLAVYMLVFGWNAMLASYSYCVDARRFSESQSRAQCLFFVLVDPSLVFPLRARPGEVSNARAIGSVLRGAFMALSASVVVPLLPYGFIGVKERSAAIFAFVFLLASSVLAMYVLRAGFAEVRIGILGLLGYRVSACFDRPYLARTPVDFWRRWNVWVGSWARRYVFWPLGSKLMRVVASPLRAPSQGGAVILTFASIGLLHDVLVMLGERRVHFSFTLAFVSAGVLAVVWEAFGSRLPATPSFRRAVSGAQYAGMLAYLFIFLRLSGYV